MTRPPWQDEFALLCERCGYVIEGLPREGHCPECGKPIAESLPEARTGTAWQQGHGPRAFLLNAREMLVSPRAAFTRMRIDADSDYNLLAANILIAATLFAVPMASLVQLVDGTSILDPIRLAIILMISGGLLALLLGGLTRIERAGIRFFGRRRGWRITRDLSVSICAHASVGWIAAVMLAWLLIPSVVGVSKLFGIRLPGYVWLPVGGGWSIPAAPLGGFFLGMLWFEWLVYTGVRQCKFANRARPGPSMPESPKS